MEDMPLAPVDVGHLYPGQCVTKQVQVNAGGLQEGIWYLGVAIEVPPYSTYELRTDNNTRASDEPMGVGYKPDFVVKSVSGPANVQPNQSFTATVELCNEGTESGSTYAYVLLSQDTNIQLPYNQPYPSPQDDQMFGQVDTGYLSPGQCVTKQVSGSVWLPQDGAWYLGAAIEAPPYSTYELRTDNNTRASDEPMGVGYKPDFVVAELSGPASATPGQAFAVTVKVCNQGTASGYPYGMVVLSEDTNIQLPYNQPYSEDYPLANMDSLGELQPGQCATQSLSANAPASQEGLWYLGTGISSPPNSTYELRTDNNTRASDEPMGIGYKPDFVVTEVSGPASVTPGETFMTTVKVCNQGTASGYPYGTLVLSQDTNIQLPSNQPSPDDSPLTNVDVGELQPGQCATQQVSTSVPMPPQEGPWYLGVSISSPPNSAYELRADNNTRASAEPMGIGYAPDFVVAGVSGPASVMIGSPLSATVKLCNQGTEPGTPYAHLMFSRDANIQLSFSQPYPGDYMLAPVDVMDPLNPGQCVTVQVDTSAYAPQDGDWFLGVAIEANYGPAELNTRNNSKAGNVVALHY
jgi:hypothetical protein